jgi:hypothetical protein
MRGQIFSVLALCALSFGCAGEISDPAVFDAELCPTDIQEDILVPRCAHSGCHVPSQAVEGLQYVTAGLEERLVGVESQTCPGTYLIDPANPDASHILVRLSPEPRCGDEEIERMPRFGDALTDFELECMRSWVTELAGGPAP